MATTPKRGKAKGNKAGPYVSTTERPPGRQVGGPIKVDEDDIAKIGRMAQVGMTDMEIAEVMGVSMRTLHTWRETKPGLADALVAGKAVADTRVVRALFNSAVGYEHNAVKIHVNANGEVTQVPYVEHVPPNPTSMIFWLKNRDKENWRDVHRVENTGKDGGPIEVAKLSDAEIEAQIRGIVAKNPKLKELMK